MFSFANQDLLNFLPTHTEFEALCLTRVASSNLFSYFPSSQILTQVKAISFQLTDVQLRDYLTAYLLHSMVKAAV